MRPAAIALLGLTIGNAAACTQSRSQAGPDARKPSVSPPPPPPPRPALTNVPWQPDIPDPPLDPWDAGTGVAARWPPMGVVSVPLGAHEPRPIMIALHGSNDQPAWAC